MSAVKLNPPRPKKPRSQGKNQRKKNTRRRLPRYRGLTLELTAKILVNTVLVTAAIAAIAKLENNYHTQHLRLEEVQQEVKQTQARVDELNREYSRHFDPYQREILMQQQTNQIKPNQRHVILVEPNE